MPGLPSLIPQKRNDLVTGHISAFESETLGVLQRTAPRSEHLVLYFIVAMIVAALVAASLVKLDRVVTATGRVVPSEGSLFVQPIDRAIIKKILVHNGDVVEKGQILATLDPTFAQADMTQSQQKVNASTALVHRLEAEQVDKPFVPRAGEKTDELQYALWTQRQGEYKQGVADFDARIQSNEAAVSRARQDIGNYQQRQRLAGNVAAMEAKLEKDGYGSKLKTIAAADNLAEVNRMLDSAQNDLKSNQGQVDSLKAQREQYIHKWHDDISTQLVQARSDLNDATQALTKASKVHELIDLRAPEDAIVLNINNVSVGSVVDATSGNGQPLFTLTPIDGQLVADIDIDSQDIGFIAKGDHVELKLDAYPFMQHGTAQGTIVTVSDGAFTIDANGQSRAPYFRVRVRIDDTNLRNVPAKFRLIPGMTLSGDVLIGKRSIMSYLISGVVRTGSEAMREAN